MVERYGCRFAVWALPTARQSAWLNGIIAGLAVKLSVRSFLPHLTIFAANYPDPAVFHSLLAELGCNLRPFSLEIEKVDWAESYFKALFLRLSNHINLDVPLIRLRERFGGEYQFDPHLSLAYAHIDVDSKRRLAAEIEASLPEPRQIVFDRLVIAAPGNRELGWADIAAWRILADASLRAGRHE